MSLVLAAIVITVLAAIFIPPYISPAREDFPKTVSVPSVYGFTLNLSLNATKLSPSDVVNVTIWLDSTSSQIQNITATDGWRFDRSGLWVSQCVTANGWWPIGISVMKGYYSEDNYSAGKVILGPQMRLGCLPPPDSNITSYGGPARYFLLEPHGSRAIVRLDQGFASWRISNSFWLNNSSLSAGQQWGGVYTAVGADEWGDVVILHFWVA